MKTKNNTIFWKQFNKRFQTLHNHQKIIIDNLFNYLGGAGQAGAKQVVSVLRWTQDRVWFLAELAYNSDAKEFSDTIARGETTITYSYRSLRSHTRSEAKRTRWSHV